MIHDPTFREGVFAGYHGLSPLTACPYDRERELEQRTKWLAGWSSGAAKRRVDRLNGRHPDVAPRSEFGVETGHRAGRNVGVRQ